MGPIVTNGATGGARTPTARLTSNLIGFWMDGSGEHQLARASVTCESASVRFGSVASAVAAPPEFA